MNRIRSHGAMLITAPSESEVLYDMSVRVAREEIVLRPGYTLFPWLRVRQNTATGAVIVSAGVTAKRTKES